MKLINKYKYLIIVITAALFAVLDLANYGIPPTHDAEYHVLRFAQFYKVISVGDFYPRWAPDFNNGFGIPLFNYVYPLPNYIASLFHVLGFGFIDSFKLNMAVASIIGSVFFYLWTKKYWGDWGGVVSSVFYTFSPYHFLDIYVRGSVGEVWSLALAPGLLWAYTSFVDTGRKQYLVVSAILLALLIYAHNILALVFFAFFLLYSLFLILHSENKKQLILNTILICFFGLGLAAPFWLPAILETKYVAGLGIYDPTQQFSAIYKLIYSSWGYGFIGPNVPDQMSTQIGIADILAIVVGIVLLVTGKLKKDKPILMFIVGIFFVSVFLMTQYSSFFWKNIPLASFVQFPWRLLSISILCVSFVAGSLVLMSKNTRTQIVIAAVLILISIGFSLKYAKAPYYHERADSHYLTRNNFTDGTNSPGNAFNTVWLKEVPPKRNEKIGVLDGKADIKIKKLKPTEYSFQVNSKESSEVVIHTAYFPGWTANVNGKDVKIKNVEGRMVLRVNSGSNNVVVRLDNTPIQNISYLYFVGSIIVLFLLVKMSPRKNRKTKNA